MIMKDLRKEIPKNRLKKMSLEEALTKPLRPYNKTGRYKGMWELYLKNRSENEKGV